LKKIFSNSLFHFLLIGIFLFLLFDWVKPSYQEQDKIIIDDEIIARSIYLFRNDWGRQPTPEELEGLIERYIRQEVLYRQALKMKLDQNDELIRRRMEQKLNFITNDLSASSNPSDDTLRAFMAGKGDKYKIRETVSFVQIYFNPEKHKDVWKEALNILSSLPKDDLSPEERINLGDRLQISQIDKDIDQKRISAKMGEAFADSIMQAPTGKWYGPILSGFGLHLVFIENRQPSKDPTLAEVRQDVLRDYQYEKSQVLNEKVYSDFRKQYFVQFDLKDSAMLKTGIDKKLGNHD